ncbi:MFS transporter [Pseudanabaena sp. SR411]|uniref:MFS transporter n=1 Tax=Pseudanabaena sp. SR411 TaxID=1980935 RepID=UPI000B98E3FC|nr:MFS transporter [Pseudanabaena sp. SR411]OYQ63506.1 MFS transporter [Pseudanabaena sp. SR411]
MRTFTILWSGQMVSAIGTEMTQFALTIWIWQLTQETTAIALLTFFFFVPQILISLGAGLLIDRCNRQFLMIISDVAVAICTSLIGILFATKNLQIWHLYVLAIVYGSCGQIQGLAFSASISSIVTKEHYARVSSMRTIINYSSSIIAPALVGVLYPMIGFMGIILIDLATFIVGISTVLMVRIPQPKSSEIDNINSQNIWQQLFWGLNYIFARPSLLAMTTVFCLFLFTYNISETLYQPMILARTGGSTQILGMVVTAAGVGGVVGGVFLSVIGGFKRQIQGMLLGFVGTGLGILILGWGQTSWIWIGAHFFAVFNIPLAYSSSYAIWYAKVQPEVQGRVLASAHTLGLAVGAIASLIAGPLADRVFEPMMNSNSAIASLFAPLVGTGQGSGIALLLIIMAIGMVLIGVIGTAFPTLRNAEELLPDYE